MASEMLEPKPWHASELSEALVALDTSEAGLTTAEAERRLREEGANRLPEGPKQSDLRRFLLQFHNLLIYLLLVAALVSFALGHLIDACVILAVVFANAVIGFVQEGRAKRALEAIKGMVAPSAAVMRDGHRVTLPAEQIVRGDLVLVEAGDRVPADIRLLRARHLRLDEAILTGESLPADKDTRPVAADAALGDRKSMAYSGTFVSAGQGLGLAVGTGLDSELGRISKLLGAVESLETPLLQQMAGFARQLTLVILGISLATFAYATLASGLPLDEAFMGVVGLAVAAIPEGLPAIMTITLAIGVRRMATRNAIIRRLPAVETLGAVSVICSDKTGTLTRNEMTARTLATAGDRFEVEGVGYEPVGAILGQRGAFDPVSNVAALEVIRASLLCNDAEVQQTETGWICQGDPMEGALVSLGMKAGLEIASLRDSYRRIDEIPFDAQHRFMATLHARPDGSGHVAIKGAPERIFDMCALERSEAGDRPLDRGVWDRIAEEMAAQGQRVLAFASLAPRSGQTGLDFADLETGAVLLGCIGFIDPPRAEAIEALRECKEAGIRVVMITGDHAVTAGEIGRQLGLADKPRVLVGQALDSLDAAGFREAVRNTDVFARTTPEHKLRLVETLQAEGLTVAMTGDGVNDAPALKRADVGVAMGQQGTEAAKQASEMVLADDNFASIVAAVREGRTVYDNLMKAIVWTLPTNGGEALTILVALAFGLALPITPVQILWVNMVTAIALGLTFAFEPTEPEAMRRPPRHRDRPILTGSLVWRVIFVSLLFLVGTFGVFFWADMRGLPIEEARTLVVNTLVVMEIFYLFSVRYVHGSSLSWRGLLGTRQVLLGVGTVVLAQLAFTYAPPLQAVFDTRAVGLTEGLVVLAAGVVVLLIVELEKLLRQRLLGLDQTAA